MKQVIGIMLALLWACAILPVAAQQGSPGPRVVTSGTYVTQANTGWAVFSETVKTGKTIVVTLVDSADVKGKLVAVEPDALRIEGSGSAMVIAASRIVQIRYAGIRRRYVLIGLLAGWACGAVTTVAIDHNSAQPSSVGEAAGLGGFFIGLPLGVVAGAAIPAGPPLYAAARTPE